MSLLRPRLVLLAASLASGAASAQTGGEPASPRTLSVAEADAYVTAVFATGDTARYDTAAEAYLSLLRRLGEPRPASETGPLLRHLRRLAPVVPDAERDVWGLDEAIRHASLAPIPASAGAQMVRWWRAQDDLPATPANERLAEHLARIAVALDAFAAPDDPRGYDDRGEVYVRLGPPDRAVTIEVDAALRAFDLRGRSPVGRLPSNAFWLYDRVHNAAQYVFVQSSPRAPYRLGGGLDLLPRELRRASRSLRGNAEAEAFLVIMEEVYGQLAVRHPAYGTPYDAVARYNGSGRGRDAPSGIALEAVSQAQVADAVAEAVRQESVPASVSTTRQAAADLPASARWARFLNPDGTTRLEVAWGVAPGALRPSRGLLQRQGLTGADSMLLSVSAVVLTDDFEPRAASHAHLSRAQEEGATGRLEVPLDPTPARLALQWQTRGRRSTPERLLVGTLRPADALAPLHVGGLEMSDLRPLASPDLSGTTAAAVYPFEALPPDGRLALSFEVYALTPDATGQTRYTVEYRITGPDGRPETSSAITYDGAETTTQEAIALDVTPWLGETVEIEVRVRDEEAGAEVQRSIRFTAPRP